MNRSDNLLNIDELKLWMGEPYVINQYLSVFQPKIRDIINYGEEAYLITAQTLTAIPSEMKSSLWDKKIDWTTLSDFNLFIILAASMPKSQTEILLGDIDLSRMRPVPNLQNDEIVLKDPESDAVIDELAYSRMTSYICKMHNFTKKVEKAMNEYTKQVLIDEDRRKLEYAKKQPYKSFLLPLLTAVKARQKYTKDYILNMGLCEFFMELSRLQIIVNTDALLTGSYSGMVDTSKIPRSQFDWLRSLDN